MNGPDNFIRLVKHPFKFRVFLFTKLPSAYICGVRVKDISRQAGMVTVPYKWLSQNPFKSTYFACLAMAAELSTGLLAMMNTSGRQPAVSMLVTGLQASYFKKATGITTFTCSDGEAMAAVVEDALSTGEGKIFMAKSVGKDAAGNLIAEFNITWSFKSKRL